MNRAMSIANSSVPGGVMTKLGIEFDKAKSRWAWKIDIQKGTSQRELKIDAGSAQVIGDEHDQESSNPRAVNPKRLSPQDAARKATALVPGRVSEWSLEWDDGVQRYEFDMHTDGSTTQDVNVAVETGKATRN